MVLRILFRPSARAARPIWGSWEGLPGPCGFTYSLEAFGPSRQTHLAFGPGRETSLGEAYKPSAPAGPIVLVSVSLRGSV